MSCIQFIGGELKINVKTFINKNIKLINLDQIYSIDQFFNIKLISLYNGNSRNQANS